MMYRLPLPILCFYWLTTFFDALCANENPGRNNFSSLNHAYEVLCRRTRRGGFAILLFSNSLLGKCDLVNMASEPWANAVITKIVYESVASISLCVK